VETYKFHGGFDFLRMLGYTRPSETELQPIVCRLSGKATVDIVDYGCGLAHRTITVARLLIANGVKVTVTFVDIRRKHHLEFLDFVCKKYGIHYKFLEVTADAFYPELPDHDYCDNVSVLEHLPRPLIVIDNIHRALRAGGLFLVAMED